MSRRSLAALFAVALLPALAAAQSTKNIQNIRPIDQKGVNVFEAPKTESKPVEDVQVSIGGAFTQQFQGLRHSNQSTATTPLVPITNGFNNAVANLYVNAQIAKGLRVAMTSYLSARHHNETWVKDGYFQIDASPIDIAPLNALMKYTTMRVGHMEINYGDAHFRRTDNGNAIYNPLVGNYIMDAFSTEIGTEVYVRPSGPLQGLMVMGAIFDGESKGMVQNGPKRSPVYMGKVGYDKQVTKLVRTRLTSTLFSQARATNQTLFAGDRAGSRYYDVVETNPDEKAAFTSGAINPGLNEMHAFVVNPFIKVGPLEYFGNFEKATGRAVNEVGTRQWNQTVNELVVRGLSDKVFAAARLNNVEGRLAGYTEDVSLKRQQVGAGWFVVPQLLLKGELVTQDYSGFKPADVRSGAQFKGFMIEGVVAF